MLTGSQIQSAIEGNHIDFGDLGVTYWSDGKVSEYTDAESVGTWFISDNLLCEQWGEGTSKVCRSVSLRETLEGTLILLTTKEFEFEIGTLEAAPVND